VSPRAQLSTEDWGLGVTAFDPHWAAQLETLFALSNGFLGWRGTLDEAPSSVGDTCRLSGFFDRFPLAYAEPAFGYPRLGQALVGGPDGAVIRLTVDGEPFELGAGVVHGHEQHLDFGDGLLRRETVWESPRGARVRVSSTRLVSLHEPGLAVVSYAVEALERPHEIVIVSELRAATTPQENEDGLEPVPALVAVSAAADGSGGVTVHATAHSGLAVAAAMHHECDGPGRLRSRAEGGGVSTSIDATLRPGHPITVVKFVGYARGTRGDAAALADAARSCVADARQRGWTRLCDEQRAVLAEFWRRADVEVDGDPRLQQAARFTLFHVFQAAALAEEHPPPAKGLTGSGYQGHTMWDLDSFVVPVLALLQPNAAASALRWRHRTLGPALDRAAELGFAGAAFPWRTIDGRESSGYWPASTAALHLNADIADAVLRYLWASGDEAFEAAEGLELLVQTARLWASAVRFDEQGGAHLDGVTGPDEYSALVDDNVYTNLMAQQNLLAAAHLASRRAAAAVALGVTPEETQAWHRTARAMVIPFDERKQVHPQSAGFTALAPWPFDHTEAHDYPLVVHRPYLQLYRHQVTKQADLALALIRRPGVFTAPQRERDFAYYEAITVRDSSLSVATQAVLAAELGQLELAADYVRETAAMDLADLHGDTRNGIHLGAAAGLWTALVSGYGGFRLGEGDPSFAPRLPKGLHRLRFRMQLRGRLLVVEVRPGEAAYALEQGAPLTITHFGRRLRVDHDGMAAAIPELPAPGPRPSQPPHRPPGLDAPR
jgi:alpha,alpha-trehalose phosphorylase